MPGVQSIWTGGHLLISPPPYQTINPFGDCLIPAGMTAREAAQYWYIKALRALQQRVSDPHQLIKEYQHVAALDDSIQHTVEVARSQAAHGRNRYCNVLPYDYNRSVRQRVLFLHACACVRSSCRSRAVGLVLQDVTCCGCVVFMRMKSCCLSSSTANAQLLLQMCSEVSIRGPAVCAGHPAVYT